MFPRTLSYACSRYADPRCCGRGAPRSGSSIPDRMQLNGANLQGAYLVNARMRQASLIGAQLYDADLRECDLSNSDLRNANCRSASLERSRLAWAYCRLADFTDANLTNADLSGTDLTGAHIERAILIGTGLDKEDTESSFIRRWLPVVNKFVTHLMDLMGGSSEQSDDIVQQVLLDLTIRSRSKKWMDNAQVTEG